MIMNKLSCEIVRDLLPSYVDGLTSDVTNAAIDKHISDCEPCNAVLNGMRAPETHDAQKGTGVDYLKKVHRRSRRTALLCSVGTVIVIIAALFVNTFVIGRKVAPELILCYDISVSGSHVEIQGLVDDYVGVASIDISETEDGVLELQLRAAPRLPFDNTNNLFEAGYAGSSDIKEIRCGDIIIWQDGVQISRYVSQLYENRNPYIGDMPANAEIAEILGTYNYLGIYTNELQTSQEPYGWTVRLESKIDGDDEDHARAIMNYESCMMLALIENLGSVTWEYSDSSGQQSYTVDCAAANELSGCDVKQCFNSISDLQRLYNTFGWKCGIPIDEFRFAIDIYNDTDCEIYGISHEQCIAGESFSGGGMCNADNSPLTPGDLANFSFRPSDLPVISGLSDMFSYSFTVSVVDSEGNEHIACEQINIPVSFCTRYVFVVTGNYDDGFELIPIP